MDSGARIGQRIGLVWLILFSFAGTGTKGTAFNRTGGIFATPFILFLCFCFHQVKWCPLGKEGRLK
jgi:hypothetical protein